MPKAITTLFVFGLLLSPATLAASLQQVDERGRIAEVTVYQNMARVTRELEIHSQTGPVHIRLDGLPGNLRRDAIQARGSDGLHIVSVAAEQVFSSELSNEREQALVDQIQALKDQRQAAQDRIEAAKAQQAFIRSISAQPGDDNGEMGRFYANPDAWAKAWRSVGEGMAETQAAMRKANVEIRKLDAEIQALEEELKQIHSNRRHNSRITVAAQATQAGPQQLSVTYDVPNAHWQPAYRAALDTETGQLALTLQAQVRQNSGEDWQDVAISLNTGQPGHATQLPVLQPWLLRVFEPQPQRQARQMDMLSRGAAEQAAAPAMRADEDRVQVIEKGFAATYSLPGKQNLASDNQPIEVAIETHELDSDLELQTVPKRDRKAYLVARFALPEGRSFPPGPVSLTRDGDFVGDARLPDIPAGKPIEFGFGQDDKLAIDYRRLPPESETSGFKLIGKSEIVTHRYVIKVENRHRRQLPLKVIDQLPVSTDERIEVTPLWDEEHGGKPPEQNLDDRKGVVAWTWELAPGADRELRFGYSIKYPQGLQVPGI